jgi:Fe-S-cluster containining protein
MLELLEAWGIIDKGQKQLTLIIWQDCQHWNQDTRLCEIYENRPKICREFLCARAQNRLSVPVKVEGAQ